MPAGNCRRVPRRYRQECDGDSVANIPQPDSPHSGTHNDVIIATRSRLPPVSAVQGSPFRSHVRDFGLGNNTTMGPMKDLVISESVMIKRMFGRLKILEVKFLQNNIYHDETILRVKEDRWRWIGRTKENRKLEVYFCFLFTRSDSYAHENIHQPDNGTLTHRAKQEFGETEVVSKQSDKAIHFSDFNGL
ncbi:hypothetical protein J6590_035389 [Homalodisca vitripennis]|nr:hypothetical protein J6590_035389 [Homalodisca vitripennis]